MLPTSLTGAGSGCQSRMRGNAAAVDHVHDHAVRAEVWDEQEAAARGQ